MSVALALLLTAPLFTATAAHAPITFEDMVDSANVVVMARVDSMWYPIDKENGPHTHILAKLLTVYAKDTSLAPHSSALHIVYAGGLGLHIYPSVRFEEGEVFLAAVTPYTQFQSKDEMVYRVVKRHWKYVIEDNLVYLLREKPVILGKVLKILSSAFTRVKVDEVTFQRFLTSEHIKATARALDAFKAGCSGAGPIIVGKVKSVWPETDTFFHDDYIRLEHYIHASATILRTYIKEETPSPPSDSIHMIYMTAESYPDHNITNTVPSVSFNEEELFLTYLNRNLGLDVPPEYLYQVPRWKWEIEGDSLISPQGHHPIPLKQTVDFLDSTFVVLEK